MTLIIAHLDNILKIISFDLYAQTIPKENVPIQNLPYEKILSDSQKKLLEITAGKPFEFNTLFAPIVFPLIQYYLFTSWPKRMNALREIEKLEANFLSHQRPHHNSLLVPGGDGNERAVRRKA